MTEKTIKLSGYGKDLSSRETAARIRNEFKQDDLVIFDFDGVRTLSYSFADELFGVLVLCYGPWWPDDHVSIVNASEENQELIDNAYHNRFILGVR